MPKAVDLHEIRQIVDGYAQVAEHCREGGFDGIELQCSHSSIVRGFLSAGHQSAHRPLRRLALPNRSRLLMEIVAAVREAIGADLALGVRLCGDELVDDGTTIDDAVAVARSLEATGHVDYINTSIGVATATLYMIEASMQVPPGYALWIASSIRKAVSLPVIGVGRFKDPLQADRALSEGHADLIGVVRGQIADSEFAAKARAGNASWIRNCLSCNQECVGRMGLNRWLGCIENPRTGRESVPAPETGPATPAWSSSAGGPPGCRAPSPLLVPGTWWTCTRPNRFRAGRYGWRRPSPAGPSWAISCGTSWPRPSGWGCRSTWGTSVDLDLLLASGADAVVMATGSVPDRPYWAANTPEGGRRPSGAHRRGDAERTGARGRRARLPSSDERGRASGRPGMCGRSHHPRHGASARISASRSTSRRGG